MLPVVSVNLAFAPSLEAVGTLGPLIQVQK